MSDTYPPIYEADEIARNLAIVNDEGDAIPQEWSPHDELGRQYVVDLLESGQAFLVTVAPYRNLEDQ